MEDGGHDGDVEEVIHLEREVVEELLAEGIVLGLSDLVIFVDCKGESVTCNEVTVIWGLTSLLKGSWGDAHLLGEGLAGLEALHEATADIVLAVPLDFGRGLSVEHQANGVLKKES